MGSFFCDLLSFNYEVAVLEAAPEKLRFMYNVQRFTEYNQAEAFKPDMVINCVTLNYTITAFKKIIPYLPKKCLLSDISSVKTHLKKFYEESGFRYISVHPMFGPTFANLGNLQQENAIIINEPAGTDKNGLKFYRDLFNSLKLNVREYTFEQHDEVAAYSLSIPFASSLVFGSVMKHQDVPGTTFKKHLTIARGLLSEDDYLLSEILFNPLTSRQLSSIQKELEHLQDLVKKKDTAGMKKFLDQVRQNLE